MGHDDDMFVLLGSVLVLCAGAVGLAVLSARRDDVLGETAQRVARSVDVGVERTRRVVGTLTVPERDVPAPYFATGRNETTWLFGIGLVGVAVACVLGFMLLLG
jgi:hypothetical protein